MATIYLRSTDGNDADNGSTWALAKATLAAALTAAGAGGIVYMSQVHAETQATTITLTSPGTAASPVQVICVNDGAAPPTAVATTGTVSTTGAANITWAGYTYVYGVSFQAADSTSSGDVRLLSTSSFWLKLDTCNLYLRGSGGSGSIELGLNNLGVNSQLVEFINTTIRFSNVVQTIHLSLPFIWKGGSIDAAGSIPTVLFNSEDGLTAIATVEGVDLSAMGSGKTIVNQPSPEGIAFYKFINCKLGASVTRVGGTISGQAGAIVDFVNCNSGDTNYDYSKKVYQGDITHETTIVRTGGASDGTTPTSRKMVTTANSKFYSPLQMDPIVVWNESTSSLTVTVHIVTDNVTLTDAECWVEVEELGTSGYPLSVTQSDRAADILATPANQTTSTEAWTTTGLTTPVYQKLHVTFTPAEKGPFRVRVLLAKASTTVYVCPKAEVS